MSDGEEMEVEIQEESNEESSSGDSKGLLGGVMNYARRINPFAQTMRPESPVKVEEGYEIRHNARGVAYYHKMTEEELKKRKGGDGKKDESGSDSDSVSSGEEEAAANEWVDVKKPTVWGHLKSIEASFGIGVRLYFDFTIIILVINIVLFLLQLVAIIVDLVLESKDIVRLDKYDETTGLNYTETSRLAASWAEGTLNVLYTSHWSPRGIILWRIVNGISIAFAIFVVSPLYYWITHRSFKRRGIVDMEGCIVTSELDRIPENIDHQMNKAGLVARRIVSYLVFGVMLLIQTAFICGLTLAGNSFVKEALSESARNLGFLGFENTLLMYVFSFAISIVSSISNTLFKKLCGALTKFEKHRTYTDLRKHHTFKLASFKLLNVFSVKLFKGLFTLDCIIDSLGQQFLVSVFVTDLIIGNITELVIPWITFLIKRKKLPKGPRRIIEQEKIKPDFDVSDEYLELIYRQYFIFSGLPVFPFISLLAVVASAVEIYIDKLKLIHLCKRPPETRGSVKSVISFFLFVCAVLAFINPGGGVLYILLGYYWCLGGSETRSLPCGIMGKDQVCVNVFRGKTYHTVVNTTSFI